MIDFSFHSDLPDGLLELVRDHISRLKGLDEPERHIVGYATKQMDIMSFRGDSLNGKKQLEPDFGSSKSWKNCMAF